MTGTASRIMQALRSTFFGKAETITPSIPKTSSVVITKDLPPSPTTCKISEQYDEIVIKSSPIPSSSPDVRTNNKINRVIKTIKPHIPLIKFRKGGLMPQAQTPVMETVSTPVIPSIASSAPPSTPKTQVYSLEWWQTPSKFKRRTIDELECDAINSGGTDKLWS